MPEDHIGTVEEWERNQDILKNAITAMGKDFVINEGDGAFYGPKLDFHLADSLGRTWQCGTIQLDSQLPERFELEYTGEDGQKHRPVMIHRVVLGSIERFIGVITEHFAGAFPAWLAPVQVKVLPVTDRAAQYADQISKDLDEAGFRVEVDHRNEKIGKKIREATMEKIPYMWGWATGTWRVRPSLSACAPVRTWAPCPASSSRPFWPRTCGPRPSNKRLSEHSIHPLDTIEVWSRRGK